MTIHARQEKSEGRKEKREKNQKETPTHLRELAFLFGAAKQIRTADLVITNDVFYHLSYSSIFYAADFHLRHNLATVKGLEPSTSSVTGWRTNRLYYTATFHFRFSVKRLIIIARASPFVNTFFKEILKSCKFLSSDSPSL